MAEAKKPAPAAAEPAAAPKEKKNVVLYVVIFLLLLVIVAIVGVGGFLYLSLTANPIPPEPVAADDSHDEEKPSKKAKPKKSKKDEGGNTPVFVKLDTFTVNLQGNTGVLQTEIHVQIHDEKQKDVITGFLPRISSQVNLLLSSKKIDDLSTVEAKVTLMEDIKKAINKVLGDDEGVLSVEFKTFIVQ